MSITSHGNGRWQRDRIGFDVLQLEDGQIGLLVGGENSARRGGISQSHGGWLIEGLPIE